jgi:hypothetical protein
MLTFNTPKYKTKDIVLISVAVITIFAAIVYNIGGII